MSELILRKDMKSQGYSAPSVKMFGPATRLTANGTAAAQESSGGSCGTNVNKNKC